MSKGAELEGPSGGDRPQLDGADIRKMKADDLRGATRTLAQAFYDDPVLRWISPDDSKRMRRLERAFSTFIRGVWLPRDECYAHERLIGAALWMPPGTWQMSGLAQLRLLPALAYATRGDLPRALRVLAFMDSKHPHEPHFYLALLGVTPAWQGLGYGAALMRPVLERCDALRLPAYHEASSPRNREFYERLGYEVVEECCFADDAPPMWRMWREPVR